MTTHPDQPERNDIASREEENPGGGLLAAIGIVSIACLLAFRALAVPSPLSALRLTLGLA